MNPHVVFLTLAAFLALREMLLFFQRRADAAERTRLINHLLAETATEYVVMQKASGEAPAPAPKREPRPLDDKPAPRNPLGL